MMLVQRRRTLTVVAGRKYTAVDVYVTVDRLCSRCWCRGEEVQLPLDCCSSTVLS
jgi:hypothetical protein